MNAERRQSPYRPRRKLHTPVKWLDVAGACAIGLATAYVLSVALQAIQ